MITASLSDCYIVKWYNTPFYVLVGILTSKDSKGRFKEDDIIRTSHIVKIEENLVYTRNSVYEVLSWRYGLEPDLESIPFSKQPTK